ncbi:MAG: hypothetical protein IPJ76_05500 [Flavobacteriales bacterium]|nr:MAG: hypothetical protein IPJ76_05500 [Flavobacteriales bacterium]
MRTLFLFVVLFSGIFRSMGQTGATEVVIPGTFDTFTTDELGNVYALRGDVLELYNPKGQLLQRNSLKTFGRIGAIDAFYSLKPMVFAQEQGQLAVLDNTLAVQGSVIDLPSNGYPQVTMVCASVQNSFWFFDQRELELVRVDAQLRPLARTGRLDQLIGFAPVPAQMLELDNWLYVNDPKRGIIVFDVFGTYVKTIPIIGALSFEVRGKKLFYFHEEGFHALDLMTLETTQFANAHDAGAIDVRTETGLIYTRYTDRLSIAPAR